MSSVGCDQVLGRECKQWPRNGENESLGFMGVEECVVGGRGCVGMVFFNLGSIWKSPSMASKILFTISNIKRYRLVDSKHNTLLRCKMSPGRRHVSAL